MIRVLRNKKYPIHPDDGDFLKAIRYFGQEKYPPDWTTLWESAVKAVADSLTLLRNSLQNV